MTVLIDVYCLKDLLQFWVFITSTFGYIMDLCCYCVFAYMSYELNSFSLSSRTVGAAAFIAVGTFQATGLSNKLFIFYLFIFYVKQLIRTGNRQCFEHFCHYYEYLMILIRPEKNWTFEKCCFGGKQVVICNFVL